MLTDIINFYQYTPTLASAGQPESNQFAEIRAAGFEVVINLLPLGHTEGLPEEPALVSDLGMEYIHIPVVWTAPTSENLDAYFQALQANQGHKVFAHCAMNFRASAFTFLYRVLIENVPVEEAEPAMREIWEPYEVWPEFIEAQLRRKALRR